MIFVTTGGQTPFDRLIRAADEWAAARGRDDLFAQIGAGDYQPRAMEWTRFVPPEEFRRRVSEAELVVAHAGMGTILTCLELEARILVMPRRASLRETRNEHQLATARQLESRSLVSVAPDESALPALLDRAGAITAAPRIEPLAEGQLVETLRDFIRGG